MNAPKSALPRSDKGVNKGAGDNKEDSEEVNSAASSAAAPAVKGRLLRTVSGPLLLENIIFIYVRYTATMSFN